jgi:hypothetical protein
VICNAAQSAHGKAYQRIIAAHISGMPSERESRADGRFSERTGKPAMSFMPDILKGETDLNWKKKDKETQFRHFDAWDMILIAIEPKLSI